MVFNTIEQGFMYIIMILLWIGLTSLGLFLGKSSQKSPILITSGCLLGFLLGISFIQFSGVVGLIIIGLSIVTLLTAIMSKGNWNISI